MQTHETRYHLLEDPLIPVKRFDGTDQQLNLPELLSALLADEIHSFPTLRPHQTHAWHAFLVQLAAMASFETGVSSRSIHAAGWKEMLLALTDETTEPWCLVAHDLSRPGFLQPPVPESSLQNFNKWQGGTRFPDEVDMLVTAKNHDLKQTRIVRPHPSHWVFALVTLQTMEGFMGRGNYGIARMNGGFASRPGVGYITDLRPGSRFRRDLKVLTSQRDDIVADLGYRSAGGKKLLWLEPWDGNASLDLTSMDPFFIEICRRIRLTWDDHILAFSAPTQGTRIDAKASQGRTGDPWTPVRIDKNPAALSITKNGFGYRLVHDLLGGQRYSSGAALTLRHDDPPTLLFSGFGLARSKGKTEAYHERFVPIAPKARRLLATVDGRAKIGSLSRRWVDEVSEIQQKALKPAILTLIQGAPDSLDLTDESAASWLRRLDEEVDQIFFERLWRTLELESEADEATNEWAETVFGLAESLLEQAIQSVPVPTVRRYRSIASAQRILGARRRNRLGSAKEKNNDNVS